MQREKKAHVFQLFFSSRAHLCWSFPSHLWYRAKGPENFEKAPAQKWSSSSQTWKLGKTTFPLHAIKFNDVSRCVQFLKSYAEEFGIPHPALLHSRDSIPPVYLDKQLFIYRRIEKTDYMTFRAKLCGSSSDLQKTDKERLNKYPKY